MDMIERVARALCEDNCDNWDAKDFRETPSGESPREMRDGYLGLAITAIKAMREPTEGMAEKGRSQTDFAEDAYTVMINTALGEHA